jgi:hypothetical protein
MMRAGADSAPKRAYALSDCGKEKAPGYFTGGKFQGGFHVWETRGQ